MNLHDTEAYQQAFIRYLRKGTPIALSLKLQARITTHYIWRTAGDGKVRASHAANEGKIFAWDTPPPTGHPGEDYNCRCKAVAYIQGSTEFANQTLISSMQDASQRWTDYDFSKHFYLGNGGGLSLAETGHLSGVVNYYFYSLGKYSSVNSQIVETARNHNGAFGYYFESAPNFRLYLYVFGGGTVSGVFTGSVRHEGDMMYISGEVEYFYDDTFTDPLSVREVLRGTSDPKEAYLLERLLTDGFGSQFPVHDYWKTKFEAEAKLDRNKTIYFWNNSDQ
ncbi:MAG: phage minor head protein [Rickettsiales bacterium]